MMVFIVSENTSVSLSGRPVMTRSVWMAAPFLTMRSVNSGRHPPQFLHVGEDFLRLEHVNVVASRTRGVADDAVGPHAVLLLEGHDSGLQPVIVEGLVGGLAGGGRQPHLQALAQQGDLRVELPGRDAAAIGDTDNARCRGPGAQLEILLAQLLELRMLRVQAAQVGVGLAGCRDLLDHILGVDKLRLAIEIGAELSCRIGDAASARILECRQRQGHLGVSQRFDARRGSNGRNGKVLRLEAPIVGLAEFSDDGRAIGDPQRRVDPRRVKRCQRGAVLCVAVIAAQLGGSRQFLL
jgi:hypothetical protein